MITLVAVVCAALAAVFFNYAAYLQKKVLVDLPTVRFRLSREVLKAFTGNRPWLISVGFVVLGGALYATALSLTGVSIVSPIVASGVALLAYLAIKNLGEAPRRVDLLAIGLNIAGVSLIAVSLWEEMGRSGAAEAPVYNPVVLWSVSGAAFLLAVLAPLALRATAPGREAAGLGITVGIMYGMNAVFARLLLVDWTTGFSESGALVLVTSPFLPAWAIATIPGFIVYQAALQRGMAVVVVPIQASLGQLVPILIGMLVLGERFPESHLLTAFRIAGFAAVLVGTVVLAQRSEVSVTEPVHSIEPLPETVD